MFLDLISNRRSIRRFKQQSVEKEKINTLIEAALRSPSSRGINPWHFIIIEDSELLINLSKAKRHGSDFLKNTPLGIVVCGDTSKSDVWVEDTSIASIIIQLAAHDLGLGSCWIQIRNREHDSLKTADLFVKEILHIPDNIMVESIIAIGYSDELKQGHHKNTLQHNKISFNTYTSSI